MTTVDLEAVSTCDLAIQEIAFHISDRHPNRTKKFVTRCTETQDPNEVERIITDAAPHFLRDADGDLKRLLDGLGSHEGAHLSALREALKIVNAACSLYTGAASDCLTRHLE